MEGSFSTPVGQRANTQIVVIPTSNDRDQRLTEALCREPATVLDCANGYQKEEVEENSQWEGDAEEAGSEGKNS
jgi:hypothetical protein